jgi:flagellar biogenesis protein FliO
MVSARFLRGRCSGGLSTHSNRRAKRRIVADGVSLASGMTPLTHYVIETLVTLLAIVALAVLVLLGARKAGMGRSGGPLELVGRLPLDARRAVYLVRVGATIYVVGASEAGIAKLGEVSDGSLQLAETESDSGGSFREVLSRAFGKKP